MVIIPQTFTRNIQPYHYLRPPQGQLDAMNEMSAEKKQNTRILVINKILSSYQSLAK
jgi:hypothetical protein